jgi:hypothetical protein
MSVTDIDGKCSESTSAHSLKTTAPNVDLSVVGVHSQISRTNATSASSRPGPSPRPSRASASSSSSIPTSIPSGSTRLHEASHPPLQDADRVFTIDVSLLTRSEGPQPHLINIQFRKRMSISVRRTPSGYPISTPNGSKLIHVSQL